LERARIIASIESDMEKDEFNKDENRYFVLIGEERHLQRQEIASRGGGEGDGKGGGEGDA
jgi:hypothetical protein